jgi:hypothetical protein
VGVHLQHCGCTPQNVFFTGLPVHNVDHNVS